MSFEQARLSVPVIFFLVIVSRLTLFLLSLLLGATLVLKNGVPPFERSVILFSLGIIAFFYWVFRRFPHTRVLESWLKWPLILLPCYLALQLIPLPLGILQFLSPERAAFTRSLLFIAPGITSAPLSISPPDGLVSLFTILGYITTFLLIRELSSPSVNSAWTPAIPLIIIGALEASLGMLQVFVGGPSGSANGTYENRDHFAGLLETILPFAAVYGLVLLWRGKSSLSSPALSALAASGIWAVAALMLVAIMYSLSRMGFIAALCGLFVVTVLIVTPRLSSRKSRSFSLAAVALAVGLIFVVFPPNQLIERFADISSTEKISADTRILLWKETLPLISEYRLFGSGLGTYEAAFLEHQAVIPQLRANYAHNDYLQYLAELGFIGFLLLAAIVMGVIVQTARSLLAEREEDRRLVSVACMGAFAAILLHSIVDFNSYVPANTFTLAWIGGIASANAPE